MIYIYINIYISFIVASKLHVCMYVCIHHHHNCDQVLCLKSLYKYIIIILVKVSFCLCLYKDIIIKYKYKYIIIIVKVSIYLCVHLQVYSPELFLPRLWKKNHLKLFGKTERRKIRKMDVFF